MGIIKIHTTPEQERAFDYDVEISKEAWLQNVWNNKTRQCINRAIRDVSDKNPKKIGDPERNSIISGANLPKAKDRPDRKKTVT